MKMSGSRQIAAPQSEVWAKLNDIDVLKRCIPGCESLERTAENDLKSTVAVKIGPMSVRFSGAVTLSELDPPTSYRISGKGQGGAAGFASGGANVKLEPKDGGTLLTYDVDATVGGKIAQLGARLIDASAAQLANQFFDRFAAEMAPAPLVAATATPSVVTTTTPERPANVAPAPAASRVRPVASPQVPPNLAGVAGNLWIWVAAGALALAVLAYLAR